MINVEELRIGNWVKSPPMSIPRLQIQTNGFLRVTGYGISVLESDTSNKLRWKPIPLTEEILLKCGFEKSNDMDSFYHIRINNDWTVLFFNPKYGVCEISINKHGCVCKNIKHLHQLQNLYWCLCGEELNVVL